MKKFIYLLLFTCLFLSWPTKILADDTLGPTGDLVKIAQDLGYQVTEHYKPKSSIVIDAKDGQILWQDNPDEIRNPASMSKLMTMYLVFEAINQGKFSMESTVTASKLDQDISKLYAVSNASIVAGVDYPVKELATMTLVPSSNVSTIMLGNLVAEGDSGKFVDLMNAKAEEIGMANTHFNNAGGAEAIAFSGLYNPEGYDPYKGNATTARDFAILAYHILKEYPQVLDFTSQALATTMKGTPYEDSFENYNYSLPGTKTGAAYGYVGVDGLKTGSSPEGAYNYTATCNKDGMRVIEIIMGVGDWDDEPSEFIRHLFGNALLDKIYADYAMTPLLSPGESIINDQKITVNQELRAVTKKEAKPSFKTENNQLILSNALPLVGKNFSPIATTYSKPKSNLTKKSYQAAKEPVAKTSNLSLYLLAGLLAISLLLILLACLLFKL
ncbi:serine hydrolase [Streptococcaceae bacterium ESL0729]|nr:serine hydrolase [Streptococcaceae bacterium ESL0729]